MSNVFDDMWEAVLQAVKSVSKKVYPLKSIYKYTLLNPPSLRLSPPSPKRAGWGNDRANRVPAAKAAVQVSPRKKKDKWKDKRKCR